MNKNVVGAVSLVIVVLTLVLAYYRQYAIAWVLIAANAALLFYSARRKD